MVDAKLTIAQAVKKHANLGKLWRIIEAVNQTASSVSPIDNSLANVLTYNWATRTPTEDTLTAEGREIEKGRLDWLQYASDLIESMHAQGRNVNGYANLLFPAQDYSLTSDGRRHDETYTGVTTQGLSPKEYINYPAGPKIKMDSPDGYYAVEEYSSVIGPLVFDFTLEFYNSYFPTDMTLTEIKVHTHGKLGLRYKWVVSSPGYESFRYHLLTGWFSGYISLDRDSTRLGDPWRIVFAHFSYPTVTDTGPFSVPLGGPGTDVLRSRARFLMRLYQWVRENNRTDFVFQQTTSSDDNYVITRMSLNSDGVTLSGTSSYLSGGNRITYEVNLVQVFVIIKFDAARAAKLFSVSAEKTLRRTVDPYGAGPDTIDSGYSRTVYSPDLRRPFQTRDSQSGYLHAHYHGGSPTVLREADYVEYPSPLSAGQLVLGTATRGQLAVSAYGDYLEEYKYLKKLSADSLAATGVQSYGHLSCLLTKALSALASSYVCIVVKGMFEYHDMAKSFKNRKFSADSLVFKHGLTNQYTGEVVKCVTLSAACALVEAGGLRTTSPPLVSQIINPFVVVHPYNLAPPDFYSTDTWVEASLQNAMVHGAVSAVTALAGSIGYRTRYASFGVGSSVEWGTEISSYIATITTTVAGYYGPYTFTADYHPTYRFIGPPPPSNPSYVPSGGPNPLANVRSALASYTFVRPLVTIGEWPNAYTLLRRSTEGDGSVDFWRDDYDFTIQGWLGSLPHYGTDPRTGEFVVGVSIFFSVGGLGTLSVAFPSDQALGAVYTASPDPIAPSYTRIRKASNTIKSEDGPITAPPLVIKLPVMGAIMDANYGFTYALFHSMPTSASSPTGAANSALYYCLVNPFFQHMPFKGPLRRFISRTKIAEAYSGVPSTPAEESAGFVGFVGNTYRVLHTGGKLAAYERSNTCPGTVTFIGGSLFFSPTGAGWEVFTLVDELNGVPYTMYMMVYDPANNMSLTSINNRTPDQVGNNGAPFPTRAMCSFRASALGSSLVPPQYSSDQWPRTTALAVMGTYRNGEVSVTHYASGEYGAHVDSSPFELQQINYNYGNYANSDPKVAGMWSWIPGNLVGTHPQSGCRALAVRFTTVMAVFDAQKNKTGVFDMSISVHSELRVFNFDKWDFFFLVGERFCEELTAFAHEPEQMTASRILVDFNTYTGHIFDPDYFDQAQTYSVSKFGTPDVNTQNHPLKVVWINKLTGLMLSQSINVPPAYFTNRRTVLAHR